MELGIRWKMDEQTGPRDPPGAQESLIITAKRLTGEDGRPWCLAKSCGGSTSFLDSRNVSLQQFVGGYRCTFGRRPSFIV